MKTVHILAIDTGLQPHVIRAAAEHFGALVSVTWVGNSNQVVDFLSSKPRVDVIILSAHGDDQGMLLPEEGEGNNFPYSGVIRPADFREFVSLAGSVVLNHACMGGIPDMAEAFLSRGASAYAGASDYIETAASTKYVLDFLYAYLLISPGDVAKAHEFARNAADDSRYFILYTGF